MSSWTKRGGLYLRNNVGAISVSPAYVTAGLTAYWNSTAQSGSESGIPDSVGGFNMTHTNSPTYDATTRLWTYNGTNQRSLSASGVTPVAASGAAAGLFTLEIVVALTSTTPNFGRVAGLNGTGGSIMFTFSGTSVLSEVAGSTATAISTVTLGTPIHLLLVGNGTTIDAYANGVKTITALAWTPPTFSNQIAFFSDPSGFSQWTTGKAGWMRYYAATALTAAQIARNYAHAKTLFSTLP